MAFAKAAARPGSSGRVNPALPIFAGRDLREEVVAAVGLVICTFGKHRARGEGMLTCGDQQSGVASEVEAGEGEVGEVPLGLRP